MRRLALAALLAVAVAGCGTRHETVTPTRTTALRVVTLAANAGEAALYAADFHTAGLSVSSRTAASPIESIAAVAAGQADLAVSTEPAVLEARAHGQPVVSVAALVVAPLSSAIWLPGSGIRNPSDLATKRVGTHGLDYERAFAQTLAGRPVTPTRDVGTQAVGALERHQVAAVVGAYSNQDGVELSVAGRKPTVRPVDLGGVPPFDELVLVARTDKLASKGDAIRSLLGALLRATRALTHGSPAASRAFAAAERGVDPRVPHVALSRTLPLLRPPAPHPFGYQDGRRWGIFADWMASQGLLRRPSDAATAFTNKFLPGEGL